MVSSIRLWARLLIDFVGSSHGERRMFKQEGIAVDDAVIYI
jgi:hypothetical protein